MCGNYIFTSLQYLMTLLKCKLFCSGLHNYYTTQDSARIYSHILVSFSVDSDGEAKLALVV